MLGVVTVQEGLRLAQERGLDLIEVAPNVTPPTCKIMDYGKYKYEEKKRAHESKKKQTVITIKELQVRPRTDQHDLDTKLRHARRFLLEGDKVKFSLRFRGREMAHQDLGMAVMQKVMEALKDICVIEAAPKMEGQQLFLMIGPDSAKIKEYKRANPNKDKEPLPELKDDDDSDE